MYQNITGNIATDYENIQSLLNVMDDILDDIYNMTIALEKDMEETLLNNWNGIDAETCEVAIKYNLDKIRNCSKWSQAINYTIKNHSKDLYERALKDQHAKEFL